ncbi:SAM-dependent methyltransferase [Salinibacter sp. 10B]|nr:SAM-dependent methyltransferase [Salinibacter sp. 10B]
MRPDPAATAHTRHRYDLWASVYDWAEWPAEQLLFRKWREQLLAPVEGPEILELGVGTGKNVPYYPDDAQVTAIDLSPEMVARARRRTQQSPEKTITVREMDVQALDFAEGQFDEVVASMVFCSVPDPVLGLREAIRVTKPGGRLRLLEHMRATSPALGRLMDRLDAPVHWMGGMHIARQTVENVRRVGWEIEEETSLTHADIFRRIVARKPK